MDDDMMMTAFERKQMAVYERIADSLEEAVESLGEIETAIERIADAMDDDKPAQDEGPLRGPQITAGGVTFNPAVTRWHGINASGMMNDITKAVQSFKMTNSAGGDVTKGYVDGQGT